MDEAVTIGFCTACVALGVSVVGGVPITFGWVRLLHYRLKRKFPEDFSEPHTDRWLSVILGILERAIITTMTIWVPQGMGPIVGALIAVKAVGAWSPVGNTSLAGRTRYFTALLGSLMSVGWAIVWGIWGAWS